MLNITPGRIFQGGTPLIPVTVVSVVVDPVDPGIVVWTFSVCLGVAAGNAPGLQVWDGSAWVSPVGATGSCSITTTITPLPDPYTPPPWRITTTTNLLIPPGYAPPATSTPAQGTGTAQPSVTVTTVSKYTGCGWTSGFPDGSPDVVVVTFGGSNPTLDTTATGGAFTVNGASPTLVENGIDPSSAKLTFPDGTITESGPDTWALSGQPAWVTSPHVIEPANGSVI